MRTSLLKLSICLSLFAGTLTAHAQALSTSPTLIFTGNAGFGDNIAQDGEGGSVTITDINIQVLPINSSGVKLTGWPLEFHSTDWPVVPMITYGDVDPLYGWSIRSDNGADFSLVAFDVNDWGDWGGGTFVAQAFRDGLSLGTVTLPANTGNTMVHFANPGALTSLFQKVDEVRVYKQGSDTWLGINNVKVSSPLSTLPVKWESFTANVESRGVLLKWSTAAELNARDFVVENSNDGRQWTAVSTVTAAGNSNVGSEYSYLHNTVLNGIHYYRIVQRDVDGKESYSKVLAVNSRFNGESLAVYPNPVVNSQVTIKLDHAERIQMFNAAGLLVFEKQLVSGLQRVELPQLKKGLYVVKAGGQSATVVL